MRAQRETFERNHLVLEAKIVDGRGLMAPMIDVGCDSLAATDFSELPEGARNAFAEIFDFTCDCTDIVNTVPRSELLRYGDQLEEMATPLREAGFCLVVAARSTCIAKPGWTFPMPISIVYLVAAPAAQPPPKVAVAKKIEFDRQ